MTEKNDGGPDLSGYSISAYREEGRYNLLSNEKQAQIVVHARVAGKHITVSDTVDIGSQFDRDYDDPFSMLDLVKHSVERYLYSSSRESTREKIKQIEDARLMLEAAYFKAQVNKYAARLADAVEGYRRALDELAEDTEAREA